MERSDRFTMTGNRSRLGRVRSSAAQGDGFAEPWVYHHIKAGRSEGP